MAHFNPQGRILENIPGGCISLKRQRKKKRGEPMGSSTATISRWEFLCAANCMIRIDIQLMPRCFLLHDQLAIRYLGFFLAEIPGYTRIAALGTPVSHRPDRMQIGVCSLIPRASSGHLKPISINERQSAGCSETSIGKVPRSN